jgi:integrase
MKGTKLYRGNSLSRRQLRPAKEKAGFQGPVGWHTFHRSVSIEKMLEHAIVDEADLLMFLLCTGVREAEAASACWTDIDLDAKIHKFTERLNLDYVPKDKEEGNVQLPYVLIEGLRARRARMPHSRLGFPTGDGKPNGHLLRIIKQLGLRAGANCGHCLNKRGLSCAKHPVCSHAGRRTTLHFTPSKRQFVYCSPARSTKHTIH